MCDSRVMMVSNISTTNINQYQAEKSKGMPYSSSKTYKVVNFGKDPDKSLADNYKEDTVLKDSLLTRFRVNAEKTTNIPLVHFPRGLQGAQDYTFFEFLQTAKFPYYVGGPVLAALFYAGIKYDKFNSAKPAKKAAKHIAVGVGLYYVGAKLAKTIVNAAVRVSRGINLEQPYRKVIPTATNQTGEFKRDTEYHKVFESADFTRWDLLYGKEGKDNQEVNEKYNKLAQKYNLDTNGINDSDSSLRPLIKKTIVMAKAWQYALTGLFVTLGIGMANQKAWASTSHEGFKRDFKNGVWRNITHPKNPDYFNKVKNIEKNVRLSEQFDAIKKIKDKKYNYGHAAKNFKNLVADFIIKPIGNSFMQFFDGQNKATSIVGKTVILTTALATVLAAALIMTKTSAKKHKVEGQNSNSPKNPKNPNEVKQ